MTVVRNRENYSLGGSHKVAFEYAARMNQARRMEWDREQSDKWFDERLAACTEETLGRLPTSGVESELPVFVVGMPRSGTSLIEQILDCHPEVYGAGELREVPQILARAAFPRPR